MTQNPLTPELARRLSEASAHREAGRGMEAIAAYREVLSQAPALPDSWYNLAQLLRRSGDPAGALAAYDTALRHNIEGPEEVYLNIGVIHADDLLDPQRAIESYKRALEANPSYIEAYLNLGNSLEDIGDRDGAISAYRSILKYAPDASEALARIANASRVSSPDEDIVVRLEVERSRTGLPVGTRASLEFALGRLLDQCGEYDRAFEAYKTANLCHSAARKPPLPDYGPEAQDRLIEAFEALSLPEPLPFSSDIQPVFILGQFRSGSTLLEQILSAHSQIRTGGELPMLPMLAAQVFKPYPGSLATRLPEQITESRRLYLDAIEKRFPGIRGIVTDKRPDNFYHIGLILQLFPNARILHTVRDPRDTCLSTYFTQLSHGQAYATDLSKIGHQYRSYERLMSYWKRIAPASILDISYEAMVSNPESEIRKALDFLGLPFEAACLDFHESAAPVKTASVWQVREPLYTRSTGRWKNYEKHLGPLLTALEGPR